MAGEFQFAGDTTAITVYAHLWSAVGTIWNGSAFEAYLTANIATYNIAMVEKGTASRYYVGTFPAAATGTYQITIQQRVSGSPAETDPYLGAGDYEWDGTVLTPVSSRLASASYTVPPSAATISTTVWAEATRSLTTFGTLVADVASAVWSAVLEVGFSASRILRAIGGTSAGKSTGGGTTFRNVSDTADAVVGTVDASNDRTSSTIGS